MINRLRSNDSGTLRKLLLSLLILGALSSLIGAGTFASFSALTTNANTFENGTVTMTNVVGNFVSGSQCSSSVYSGTCSVLFNAGSTNLAPGGSAATNYLTITYTGSLDTTTFKLYATSYGENATSSSPLCTASDPGLKLNLLITVGTSSPATIFNNTLSNFNSNHSNSTNGLSLAGGAQGDGDPGEWTSGDAAQYNISISLASDADNTYQGCQQDITFNWYAAQ